MIGFILHDGGIRAIQDGIGRTVGEHDGVDHSVSSFKKIGQVQAVFGPLFCFRVVGGQFDFLAQFDSAVSFDFPEVYVGELVPGDESRCIL